MPNRSLMPEAVERYMTDVIARETPLQSRLRAETARLPNGGMQIGADQGAFFALLIRLTGARRALEIGTFTGYSALAVAAAPPARGLLLACRLGDAWTPVAPPPLGEAGLSARVRLLRRP